MQKQKAFDVTLPGEKIVFGCLHPISQAINKLADIFLSMGFEVVEGPELETDYYNFESLNIPFFHPSRDIQDTFYVKTPHLKDKFLMRTQTSNVQVRVMEKRTPPLRICTFGRCFRREATDASHEHTFYQIEGFVVDKKISIANLIYTMRSTLSEFFGKEVKIRLRPAYFPLLNQVTRWLLNVFIVMSKISSSLSLRAEGLRIPDEGPIKIVQFAKEAVG